MSNGADKLHTLETIAARLRNFAAAIIVTGAVLGSGISYIVVHATSGVRAEIAALHDQIIQGDLRLARRADSDSVRFERVMDVVELAVAGLIEPEGSIERKRAIEELRARRHVTLTR